MQSISMKSTQHLACKLLLHMVQSLGVNAFTFPTHELEIFVHTKEHVLLKTKFFA